MEPTLAVAVALAVLLALLVAGVSVAISLLTSGAVGLLLIDGLETAGSVVAATSYSAVAKGSLIVVPMFVLMGMLTLYSGIAEQLFAIASRLLRWLPGSLGISTVFASAGFGAISGSSLATVATLGRTCIIEMMRHGYQRAFASATVAASGTLAVLIPPSIILVLYGVITGESVGALLIAGIVPGVISAILLGGGVCLLAWRRPALVNQRNQEELALALRPPVDATVAAADDGISRTAPGVQAGAESAATARSDGAVEPVRLTVGSVSRALGGLVVLFSVVIGGIYTGVFTPTESAAVGAFAAFLLLLAQLARRPRELAANLSTALRETASLNAMIFLILVGAGVFSFFLVSAGVPSALSSFVVGLGLPPALIVAALLVFLIPAGMFLDSISLLVITVPLVYGPITDLGYDGIWLGILVVKLIEIGMITPPVGMNAYVAAGTTPGLQVEEVFRGLLPFYFVDVVLVCLIFAIPDVVTWLPSLSAG